MNALESMSLRTAVCAVAKKPSCASVSTSSRSDTCSSSSVSSLSESRMSVLMS